MFQEIRRKDRVLDDEARIAELLRDGEYGFLSLGSSVNGYAYGIPLNYAYDKETHSLYFHCAPEGHKLAELKNSNKVSFCIVGNTQPIGEKFTTLYESILVFGKADIDLSDDEKRKALWLLVDKYSKGSEHIAGKYIEGSWNRVFCFKLTIDNLTAKTKVM